MLGSRIYTSTPDYGCFPGPPWPKCEGFWISAGAEIIRVGLSLLPTYLLTSPKVYFPRREGPSQIASWADKEKPVSDPAPGPSVSAYHWGAESQLAPLAGVSLGREVW